MLVHRYMVHSYIVRQQGHIARGSTAWLRGVHTVNKGLVHVAGVAAIDMKTFMILSSAFTLSY